MWTGKGRKIAKDVNLVVTPGMDGVVTEQSDEQSSVGRPVPEPGTEHRYVKQLAVAKSTCCHCCSATLHRRSSASLHSDKPVPVLHNSTLNPTRKGLRVLLTDA